MVKNTKAKGQRIERKAEDWLEERGYLTQRQNNHKFGDNDYFNWFDILAMPTPNADLSDLVDHHADYVDDNGDEIEMARPDSVILAQVKANTASGVRSCESWLKDELGRESTFEIDDRLYYPHVTFLYMVWHDREGWRILKFDGSEGRFVTTYDER